MQFGEYDFRTFTFGQGAHETREDGMCVMEAVAYVAGEPHSDHPACASPVIADFMRSWNDGIQDDNRRRELLSQFVFRLPGTKATAEVELRRSWMCFDWLVRECAAEFMSLLPSLTLHAEILRGLPEINASNVDVIIPVVRAAGAAARDAAWAAAAATATSVAATAARDAAGAAAWAAARDAAGATAWAAAWAAARDAAWAAAAAAATSVAATAARDAAGAAAWAAAGDAAGDALALSVARLQRSAVTLVDRMIRLTEIQEIVEQTSAKVAANAHAK